MVVIRKTLLVFLITGLINGNAFAAFWKQGFPEIQLPVSMQVQVVSDDLIMNGLRSQILSFSVDMASAELVEFFADEWPDEMAVTYLRNSVVMAHREGDFLITVEAREQDSESSSGLITVTDYFAARDAERTTAGLDIDLPSGTEVLQHLRAEDLGKKSETLLLASTDSVGDNLDYYRSYFRDQGFVPLTKGALRRGRNGGAMILNRQAEQLNIAVSEFGGERQGDSMILIVRVEH